MKQTAVEWLVKELYNRDMIDMTIYQKQDKSFEKIIEQAKEMYEQEVVKIYEKGMSDGYDFATKEAQKEINKIRGL